MRKKFSVWEKLEVRGLKRIGRTVEKLLDAGL